MKVGFSLVLFIVLTLTGSVSFAQQELTFTTTSANITSSMARIDLPGLANKPDAIIVATPLYDPAKSNLHAIGVWYYNNKWFIFNTDHATMPEGLKFTLQVFLKPGPNEFLQIISNSNFDGGFSFIDHPLLNNNPNAQVKILQNHSPDIRAPNKLNPDEAKAIYNAPTGKWYIQNVNGNPLSTFTAYNVVITDTKIAAANTSFPTATPYVPIVGATLAPPTLTVVVKTQWEVPPQGNIAHSSGLCKIVYGTYNNPNILATDTVIVTGQAELEGAYLQWTATVANGAIYFNVCNWKQMTLNAQAALYLNGRKINILVLR